MSGLMEMIRGLQENFAIDYLRITMSTGEVFEVPIRDVVIMRAGLALDPVTKEIQPCRYIDDTLAVAKEPNPNHYLCEMQKWLRSAETMEGAKVDLSFGGMPPLFSVIQQSELLDCSESFICFRTVLVGNFFENISETDNAVMYNGAYVTYRLLPQKDERHNVIVNTSQIVTCEPQVTAWSVDNPVIRDLAGAHDRL